MFRFLTLIANPIHTALLRSPLHRLVSHRMILLSFRGRKSGRKYTFPVYYARVGDDLRFFTLRSRRWWLNLLRGTWVHVRLCGVEYDGIAEHVPASRQRMIEALLAYDTGMSHEEAEMVADARVMFNIRLQTVAEESGQRVRTMG